ncbi:hypothetical protein Zmor_011883 [Zophobas morio]|uniref:ABC transporter domain-containing protein n=1 Tax=Zophobas morio TaxID=2755281 RepID=A0AA38LYP6_9CUCU|nr:hypothetical protein Zmor_011883 [Zophobas morio]
MNLQVQSGEIVAIMGASGAGKTTLLNLMSGLDRPTAGSIEINGKDLAKLKEPLLTKTRTSNISYIFQDYKLLDYLSPKDNILLTQHLNKKEISEQKLNHILSRLGLTKLMKLSINQLSGGQKQRVAIARALIGDNNLIFADEPTGALDLFTRDEIMKELTSNAKEFGKTVIMVTHDPYVAAYANRIIFIHDGKIESNVSGLKNEEISRKLFSLTHNE